MPRGLWGALVLVLAVGTAVAGPGAFGLGVPVAGAAVRSPVPGPPEEGDCLTSPYFGAGSVVSVEVAVGAPPYADCRAGDRRRWVFGEIVSVTPDIRAFPVIRSGDPAIPDRDACTAAVRSAVGWTSPDWDPVVADSVTLVGPDLDQYLSGQRWIACAITSGDRGYPGSAGDASVERGTNVYGRCERSHEEGRESAASRVRCDEPHDGEVFGVAMAAPAEVAALVDSCVALITERTGLAEPTVGGSLAVRVGVQDDPVAGDRVQLMVCGVRVVDDRVLVASLVGLGDGPLPWG